MKEFIQNLVKADTFFDTRQNIKVIDVTQITATMFPSKTSFGNAERFLSIYDKSGTNPKALLTYEVNQEIIGALLPGRQRSVRTRVAKGFQLYVKFIDDLYVILDRRESQAPGAGQLLLRYMSDAGTKQGSIQFNGSKVFENLKGKYDAELITLMSEHGCSLEAAEEMRAIFIF